MLLIALVSCNVVEAPEDLDGLIVFTWSAFDGEADALNDALTNLETAASWSSLSEVQDGTVSDLTAEDMALVGMDDADVAATSGVWMLNQFDCDFEHYEDILLYQQQDELFDIYDAYARTFTGDESGYRAGTETHLTWTVDYESKVLTESYTTTLNEEIRRFTTEDHGDVLMVRRAMPEPVQFVDETNTTWNQDYTIRTFWERADGELVHLYGMWRDVWISDAMNAEVEGVQRLLLDGLYDLDVDAAQHCVDGVP